MKSSGWFLLGESLLPSSLQIYSSEAPIASMVQSGLQARVDFLPLGREVFWKTYWGGAG